MAVAENECAAYTKEATAESANADFMEGERRHNEKMKMANSLKVMAEKGHMIVSGKNGQDLLNFYNDTLETVAKR